MRFRGAVFFRYSAPSSGHQQCDFRLAQPNPTQQCKNDDDTHTRPTRINANEICPRHKSGRVDFNNALRLPAVYRMLVSTRCARLFRIQLSTGKTYLYAGICIFVGCALLGVQAWSDDVCVRCACFGGGRVYGVWGPSVCVQPPRIILCTYATRVRECTACEYCPKGRGRDSKRVGFPLMPNICPIQ